MRAPKGKQLKISKVKRNNQKRTKLVKQGKLKQRRHKKKLTLTFGQQCIQNSVVRADEKDQESDQGEDMAEMIEKDDLEFLKSSISQKSYSIFKKLRLGDRDLTNFRNRKKEKIKKGIDENLSTENEYEDIINTNRGIKKVRILLPIKTTEGVIKKRLVEEDTHNGSDDDSSDNESKRNVEELSQATDISSLNDDKYNEIPKYYGVIQLTEGADDKVSTLGLVSYRQQILKSQKLQIGLLSSGLLENPQLKVKNFKILLDFMDETNPEVCITVKKIAIVSLFEVFKDLLPSYYINEMKEEGVRYKKDTLELKNYEAYLLRYYKSYLQRLEKLAGKLRKNNNLHIGKIKIGCESELRQLAVTCMCQLITTHPYFNFSVNIAQFLIPLLNNKQPKIREIIFQCFSQIFRDDKRSEISLFIVKKLNQYIRQHKHRVHTEVISILLFLKIKDVNLDKDRRSETEHKKFMNHKQRIMALSKRERKKNKKLEELEKEMLETKAVENNEQKKKIVTEIANIVFTIYFRILKKVPNRKLLSACLEGLAKFAECINLELYHDLVNVMNTLVRDDSLGLQEQLHCIQTVFRILAEGDSTLKIDPYIFYVHLYERLFNVHAGSMQKNCQLIIYIIVQILINRRKRISSNRLIAFVKRIAMIALQMQHHGTLGILSVIQTIMRLDNTVDILLDTDSNSASGLYEIELNDPEYCNAHCSALWELIALQRHYHNIVQKISKHVAYNCPTTGEGSLPFDVSKLAPLEFYQNYNPMEVTFNPAVPGPKKSPAQKRRKSYEFSNRELEGHIKEIKRIRSSPIHSLMDFYNALV